MISLVLTTFILTFNCSSALFDPTVNTPSGTIIGKTIFFEGIPVKAFLGIPFVKPPVGDLRFKKPLPVSTFGRPYVAKTLPPGCPQYAKRKNPTLDDYPGLTEDCLYLNVWVPPGASAWNRKSVMFWVHTGGFTKSSTRLDFFQGQVLAAKGDVIVVSANYRLGTLGFFYSATDDAPGNMGILDMIESLKWVKKNIESFGGDENSTTLFGHSAGGIAIGLLTVSPLTRGLFQRAILQSGSPTSFDGEDNERAFTTSQMLAKAVGCSDGDITLENAPDVVMECMRGIDPFELAEKLPEVANPKFQRVYYPRYGDEVLPQDPRVAVINGDFEPVDLLIGGVSGEGSPLLTTSMPDVFGYFGQKDPQINLTFGEEIIRKQLPRYPDPDGAVRQYLGEVDPDDFHRIRYEVFTAKGDYERLCPAVYFAESFAEKNANVYFYYFTRHVCNTPWAQWMLAVHFDETPVVFGYPLRYPQNYTLGERILSERMIQYWTTFAKTGQPDPGIWPQYSKDNPTYKHLDTDRYTFGIGPHRGNCDFFRSTFGF